MNELMNVYKTLRALNRFVLEKKPPNAKAEMYQLGYTDALQFAMSLITNKIIEAEEKENA